MTFGAAWRLHRGQAGAGPGSGWAMHWLTSLVELLLGAVSLGGLGTSVTRTVVVPRNSSSRLLRGVLWAVLAGARRAPRMPKRSRRPGALDLVLPTTLLLTLAGWLCWLGAGFFLVAMSVGVPVDADGVAGTLLLQQRRQVGSVGRVVGLAAWGCAVLVIALCAA